MMGATSLYHPFPFPRSAAPLTWFAPLAEYVGTLRGREGGGGRGGGGGGEGEQAEEEGCRSELERTKRSFVGALYTAELY